MNFFSLSSFLTPTTKGSNLSVVSASRWCYSQSLRGSAERLVIAVEGSTEGEKDGRKEGRASGLIQLGIRLVIICVYFVNLRGPYHDIVNTWTNTRDAQIPIQVYIGTDTTNTRVVLIYPFF